MEKQGVIDERTPLENKCCGNKPRCTKVVEVQTKQAVDSQEEHLTGRLSDAAKDAFKKKA